MPKLAHRSVTSVNERQDDEGVHIMTENTHKDFQASMEQDHLSLPLPREIFEQIEQESARAGGEWSEPAEYDTAVGRTMFDLPSSEDDTVTVLLSKDDIHQAPSQALVRIRSVSDSRRYLGIVVAGPFAEPDGLRGDAPIMITTAVRGGIFMPRYHGRVQVELLGEELDNGVLIPPRLRPLPNSPIFMLEPEETASTLRLEGDITIGVPVGYEDIIAAIPSDKKSVLPRHLGILGTTGGGKSTTVSSLTSNFQQSHMATIVIDTEGEYTQIYEPTNDPVMLSALEKRKKLPVGVENVHIYHLVERETTCPDKERVTPFSLQFSQLSPYLVMEILELNEAQQQRYQKAYDIAKRILQQLQIFPVTDEDKQLLFELDELERGYYKMNVEHMYDVVRACADLVAGEKLEGNAPDAKENFRFRFRSPEIYKSASIVTSILKAEKRDLPTNVGSWRVVLGRLSQLIRMKIFDNKDAGPLTYADLTLPGHVSIIDLSDTDSPQINNLIIE